MQYICTTEMAAISQSQGHLRLYLQKRCSLPQAMSLPNFVGITAIVLEDLEEQVDLGCVQLSVPSGLRTKFVWASKEQSPKSFLELCEFSETLLQAGVLVEKHTVDLESSKELRRHLPLLLVCVKRRKVGF